LQHVAGETGATWACGVRYSALGIWWLKSRNLDKRTLAVLRVLRGELCCAGKAVGRVIRDQRPRLQLIVAAARAEGGGNDGMAKAKCW
jgi:hypothetical protein